MTQAKDNLRSFVEQQETQASPDRVNYFGGLAESAFQGATFGFGDEIEAAIRKVVSPEKTYAENLKDARASLEQFRQQNPGSALTSEIAGAIVPTIVATLVPGGQAALVATGARITQGVRALGGGRRAQQAAQAAAASGAQSALYGAGAAEGTPAERLDDAATAGAIGTVAGPIVDRVARTALPAITDTAKKAIRQGVPLTPGQAVGESNVAGAAFRRLEESAGRTVYGIGDAIEAALRRSQVGFNRAAVLEALDPLDIPRKRLKGRFGNLDGVKLIDKAHQTLQTEYGRLLPKLKIDDVGELSGNVTTILKNADEDLQKQLSIAVKKHITSQIQNGGLSGNKIKEAQRFLREDILRLRTANPTRDTLRLADELDAVRGALMDSVRKENPTNAAKLAKIDQAYGNFVVIENASARTVKNEMFTPTDVMTAARAGPRSQRRRFARGQARMQRFGREMEDLIGSRVPDSGTASRLGSANLMTGGGIGTSLYDPSLAPYAAGLLGANLIGGPMAYSRPIVPALRTVVGAGPSAARAAVPVLAGTDLNQRLADALMNR
ncbi:MAG TPA: hypothetical protein DE147_13695 [Gammaproteobacteria bacterium]|nr:hypothetical protein [Gammaproteobacteria bacterium]